MALTAFKHRLRLYHLAYVLVDMGAMHVYISEKFMSACSLTHVIANSVMHVSMPFGCESMMINLCRSVDVLLEEVHMSIDMLAMLISDYDVVLGLNWLTKYEVILDCPRMKLRFEFDGRRIDHSLVNLRPRSMPIMELWENLSWRLS